MPHIEYYFSTISPYTYIAGTRLEEVASANGATITYKPLDLIALFSRTGGVPPGQRHESRQAWRLQELRRQAAKAGVPINLKPAFWPTNAAPSCYAVIAAQNAGGGNLGALVQGFTRAVWAEEKDISDDRVIREILGANGYDPSLADSGLLSGAEAYERNLEEAVTAGAFGAPFYITDRDERFWGQDRIEDLELSLQGKL
ncbi:2-hydroxychromene-2-carboxylate isomerase [Actibacterium mucosum KCTC 23349]|uniref:2-hydroxychromene-2-carboxylate isomerase n=1 Tax=Actibacterium mucosum KCTC 23349 TaxID=1454373 RepID=A0A037ZHL8_9RHOB|nr:2-hydroxychromene-2-carboxylate isomerase [Actibacterium mucosum]KAJ55129.1 2-hydroxychromene-2-carboxylate isomerase [Actibacterium mucosum KCTC 23349]